MQDLKITLVQTDLIWENPEANRAQTEMLLGTIREKTDLIVLCEMFTTGFTMQPEKVAEPFDLENMSTLNRMRSWAAELDAVVTGSVAVEENGKYYNRLLWVRPDGSFSMYDKRHTFTFAGENLHYESGNERIIEEWRGWKICPLICYDLRFPVWSRNTLVDGKPMYDLLIYVANWPSVRREPWQKLLLARAIENQCYTVGLNRVGHDANNNEYSGDSSIINPRGEYLLQLTPSKEELKTQAISRSELEEFRMKFPVLNDGDGFELRF